MYRRPRVVRDLGELYNACTEQNCLAMGSDGRKRVTVELETRPRYFRVRCDIEDTFIYESAPVNRTSRFLNNLFMRACHTFHTGSRFTLVVTIF